MARGFGNWACQQRFFLTFSLLDYFEAEQDKVTFFCEKLTIPKDNLPAAVHLRSAAEKASIGRIGWHTFRHTYSTLLHAYGTDMKVQQELLRDSDIRTTMNIYMHTVSPALREANSKVVRMILPDRKRA